MIIEPFRTVLEVHIIVHVFVVFNLGGLTTVLYLRTLLVKFEFPSNCRFITKSTGSVRKITIGKTSKETF